MENQRHDPNSPQLTWFWDFDRSVDLDENGNTADDRQASGDLVTWSFSEVEITPSHVRSPMPKACPQLVKSTSMWKPNRWRNLRR